MKKISFLLLVFGLGFGLHWAVNRLQWVQSVAKAPLGEVAGVKEDNLDPFVSQVVYDGVSFRPNEVIVKKGNYLAVINKSKTALMWLTSAESSLVTKRGYGEGEMLQVSLTNSGLFKVSDRNNLKASFSVKVE